MTDRVLKLVDFVKENEYCNMQTFDCRNTVGDPMVTIYNEDGITVDICYYYDYLEIFGLTDKEYKSLSSVLDIQVCKSKRLKWLRRQKKVHESKVLSIC